MIKRWLSNFIKNNKDKFRDIGVRLIIIAIVIFIAATIMSMGKNVNKEENTIEPAYKPTSTVISGKDIVEEKYEEDENTVDKFMEYCNSNNAEAAYAMLTDECKKNEYTNIDLFKKMFVQPIFASQKTYNLQSWVNNSKYTVYKIRIIDDLLSTGNYANSAKYETYITTYADNTEKVSIGEYIYTETVNKTASNNYVVVNVSNKNIYRQAEEYEISVRNLTDKRILLDSLLDHSTIKLYGKDGNTYLAYYDKLGLYDLEIEPYQTLKFKVKFKKSLSSYNESSKIYLGGIITDYDKYEECINNNKEYNDELLKININI